VGVGQREQRQESECLPAKIANAAANANPVMVFVMRLFAPPTVADDGVLQTRRALAKNDFLCCRGPIGFEVVLCRRKWDKENRRG
jgi:hypothetical protein